MKLRPMIYVAGPMTLGDTGLNVRRGILAGAALWRAGFLPFVPQLSHLWHIASPMDYEDFLEMDFQVIRRCQGLARLHGESPGADREEALAREIKIPVFPQGVDDHQAHGLVRDLCRYFHPRGVI